MFLLFPTPRGWFCSHNYDILPIFHFIWHSVLFWFVKKWHLCIFGDSFNLKLPILPLMTCLVSWDVWNVLLLYQKVFKCKVGMCQTFFFLKALVHLWDPWDRKLGATWRAPYHCVGSLLFFWGCTCIQETFLI